MTQAHINSPSNERIKRLVRLRDRRHRDGEGVFVVEGRRLLSRAIDSGMKPLETYVTESLSHQYPEATQVAGSAMDKASYRGTSEGVIAVFAQLETDVAQLNFRSTRPLILVAESIEKPGNLGAILRTANAVGADAVIAIGDSVDFFNPNVVRSSTGALFTLPVAAGSVADIASLLDASAIPLVAADPSATLTLWDIDLTGPVALAVGAEHGGLSPELASRAASVVSIPMHGQVDSLNASVSMSLLAYEAVRQRLTR